MVAADCIALKRDVAATLVPAGTPVTLLAGESAQVTQALGGSYTVVVNGNMFRIDGRDADALGIECLAPPPKTAASVRTREEVEKLIWDALKTCYDPEIPVNIVDMGLVYSCVLEPGSTDGTFKVDIKMTLTAPGCGMGPILQQDVRDKVQSLDGVEEVQVDLVWEPPWTQSMLTDAAKLALGLY
ncbi:MAG TPA: putative Fe-S cluster assembly protein SufT [Verrucomicrobiota bacterium]|nr:putative Fe-S cluster assembly protein SufT [Verrucomicrobiota bacterium]HRZ35686.1 putative Fe-S cluster assembly protein SufT [Candidatus Paceibacterota bacterium]HRZ57870.1 putative Fe-S cluster assembly protein SufT [Candidatus Paceibacterota bacterium]